MKDSFSALHGPKSYIIIHLSPTSINKLQRQQTKELDILTKCSEDDGSFKQQHTRSTQVYPNKVNPGNYSHQKNQSTQTEQPQEHNIGVQTVPCSQSSNASQTASNYFDIPRSGPFSTTTTNNPCISTTTGSNSFCSTSTKAYLNRQPDGPIIHGYDGPRIHGPFSCDCPGGVCKHRS